ncbi:MAG TPA: cell division protein SepF [Xenococcaceae cyanobacterium]
MNLQSTSQAAIYFHEPQSQKEILSILETLKQRKTVILNLEHLQPQQAQQAADLIAGCSCAIDGTSTWIGKQTFLYTPSNVIVSN